MSVTNAFLSNIGSRMSLVRAETARIRESIINANKAEPEGGRLFSTQDDMSLIYRYGAYRQPPETFNILKYRQIDCAIFLDDRKIAGANFLEVKAIDDLTDHDLFWELDKHSNDYAAIGTAFLSGWDAYNVSETGSFVVLDHLATTSDRHPAQWSKMLNEFIEQKLLKDAFVMLTNPYPHDVVNIINEGHRDDAMQDFARRRHEAKWNFAEKYLGFTKYSEDAYSSNWMYKMSDKCHGPQPEFRKFDICDLDDAMRIDNPRRRRSR
jgi:hypothetical protein